MLLPHFSPTAPPCSSIPAPPSLIPFSLLLPETPSHLPPTLLPSLLPHHVLQHPCALYPNPPLLSPIGGLCIVQPHNHRPVPNSSPATFTDSWTPAFSSFSSFTWDLASTIFQTLEGWLLPCPNQSRPLTVAAERSHQLAHAQCRLKPTGSNNLSQS